MKKVLFVVVIFAVIVITLIIYILPPVGLPMSISSKGVSIDIRHSKKMKVFLWEYEIKYKNNDSIPFKISEAYCEKQHYWKMNQMIYLPNLYEDESKVQIRINSKTKDKMDEYRIDSFNLLYTIGFNRESTSGNLKDTLKFDIYRKTANDYAGGIILIKKTQH